MKRSKSSEACTFSERNDMNQGESTTSCAVEAAGREIREPADSMSASTIL